MAMRGNASTMLPSTKPGISSPKAQVKIVLRFKTTEFAGNYSAEQH